MGVPSFWQPYVLPTICFHSTALWRQTHFIFSVLHFLMLHIIGFTSYIQATICEKSSKGNRRVKEADFHTGSDKIIFTTYFSMQAYNLHRSLLDSCIPVLCTCAFFLHLRRGFLCILRIHLPCILRIHLSSNFLGCRKLLSIKHQNRI